MDLSKPEHEHQCQECRKRRLCKQGQGADRLTSGSKLQAAANSGCGDCAIVIAALRAWGIRTEDGDKYDVRCGFPDEYRGYQDEYRKSGPLQLTVLFPSIGRDRARAPERMIIEIFMENNGHDQFGFGRTPPQNSSANSTFQLASKWLHECLEKHDICSQSNGGVNPRPARLIDIGTDSDNQNIRVCDVHTLIPPYFTLSYCWGGKEFLKSDSKTLNRWKENIPWELVPKTFQDAVIITRRLGYRYLWIDSLCILQDSNDDWQIESSKMASIYEHGVLNIFAALAPNADYGCFHDRHYVYEKKEGSPHEHVHPIQVEQSGGGSMCAFTRRPIAHGDRAEVQEEPPLPLYQRGWAFQERYLSPRALYYRHFEVYWRCRVATHCECGSFSAGIDEEQHDKFRFLRLETDEIPHPEDTSADTGWANVIRLPFGPWEKVVQAYSRCQLSYISDKLPAVSGLAKRFRQQEFGAYFAGIWESQLPRGLLWHGDDQPNKRRPDLARGSDSYRAPSWSWASVNGAVDFGCYFASYRDHKLQCEVVDVQCESLGLDPTGEVKSGHIVLRGWLVAARFQSEALALINSTGPGLGKAHLHLDDMGLVKIRYEYQKPKLGLSRGQRSPVHSTPEERFLVSDKVMEELREFSLDRRLYYMIVSTWDNERVESPTGCEALLIRETSSGTGLFERIGVYCVGQRYTAVLPAHDLLSNAVEKTVTII